MDLRDYREMPDEGLFGKIERRVRMRRLARIGGVVLAVVAVAGVAVALYPKQTSTIKQQPVQLALAEPQQEELTVVTVEPQPTVMEPVAKVQSEVAAASVTPTAEVREEEVVYDCVFGNPLPAENPQRVVEDRNPVTVSGTVPEPVVSEETPVVVENTPAEKDGSQIPVTPHYDNLLWAPNVIAPAADDERNRVFKVTATSEVSHFHLIIFNRGGRQVFATDDINATWDATMGGVPLSQGTYVWVAKFRDSDGVLRQEKGTVTVIR